MPDLYFLVEFPIFRDFDADDIEALSACCTLETFKAGSTICREGDPGDAMFVLKNGVLEVSRAVEGASRHINLLSAGEFFGEMSLVDGGPRSADVVVKEDAELMRLPADGYRKLKKEHPVTALKVADVMLKQLSFRVRRSTSRALESEVKREQGRG
jgi:CRP-like cAMP-binding protein